MHWPSPWSEGFPGWHLECSAMSVKYLGETFDIHGGGMDLLFPHHECEIAQSTSVLGKDTVRYWIHNNMITINGQKMGKSLGNYITLEEIFTGSHNLLKHAYSPMTIRFFILQAHYRSTLDFSNEALESAEIGLQKLFAAIKVLPNLKANDNSGEYVKHLKERCYEALNEDLNSPILIAHLFDAVRVVNSIKDGLKTISEEELDTLKEIFKIFAIDILGLVPEDTTDIGLADELIKMLLNFRLEAKTKKDFATSDRIRDELAKLGVIVKDKKDGFEWEIK
jgi:Cysteinyl-tRNA synthetase